MSDIFLSYAREDLDFVGNVTEALRNRGRDIWVDLEGIYAGEEFWARICAAIEAADTFVFVISPHSADSDYCRREIDYAVQHHKRIVPILRHEVSAGAVPEPVASRQWIFFREEDHFDRAVQSLVDAIDTDIDWVRAHTRLLVRASEWDQKGRDDSFLLRGSDLKVAEDWLTQSGQKQQRSTALQTQYIVESRKGATNRQRKLLSGVIVALIVAIGLGITAFVYYRTAEKNRIQAEDRRQTAVSRQLAAQALVASQDQLDLSLLLSLEALRVKDTSEARRSFLGALLQAPYIISFLQGHTDKVDKRHLWYQSFYSSLAFSPDGSLVASTARGDALTLWDVANRRQTGRLSVSGSSVTCVAFSPDGRTLASGVFRPQIPSVQSAATSIILWDFEKQKRIGQPMTGHSCPIESLDFSPDGKILASGSCDGTAILWDLSKFKPLHPPLDSHTHHVTSVAFSPDGSTLATGSLDGTVMLWDTASHKRIVRPLARHTKPIDQLTPDFVRALAYSADGKRLASVGEDNTIVVWDLTTFSPVGNPLKGHTGRIVSLDSGPHSNVLASASHDGTILLWDLDKHKRLGQPLIGHGSEVMRVAFSPDGKMLVSVSPDGVVILWEFPAHPPFGQQISRLTGKFKYEWVETVTFSPDGRNLFSGDNNGNIFLWETASGRKMELFGRRQRDVQSLALSPDGKMLASGSYDGTTILWDVARREPIFPPFSASSGRVFSVAFTPDGSIVASGTDEGIVLWSVGTGKEIGTPLKHPPVHPKPYGTWITGVAFSPNGKMLASSSADKTICLWEVSTRQKVGQPLVGHKEIVSAVAFSPDGKQVASASHDNTIMLWDVDKHQAAGIPLAGHENNVKTLAFSPDGTTLVSGALYNGTVALWDVRSRTPLARPIAAHSRSVYSVSFSPDGKTFASAGDNNEILLWDASIESLRQRACRIVNRNLTRAEWDQYFEDEPYRETCSNLPGP